MINLGVLASGSGTNLQAIIDAAEKKEISAEVKVVISDREDAYALQRAKKHNIPNYFVNLKNFSSKEEYEREILRILKEHNVDLVVLAGYMKIVGKTLLSAYRNRIMNIHPALLPSFPGLEAWKQAIDYGVKISGVTVHFVDEGMDTGPIILQAAVPVFEDDTPDSLLSRIHQEEYKIYKKAIQLFAEGKLKIEGRKVRILEG
jgi:phosphoribosylglycinamide formyltransferase-1